MKKVIFLAALLICLLSGFNKVICSIRVLFREPLLMHKQGETLVAVNIVEIDRNGRFINGAVSDINGNYVLRVTDVNNEIQISYIGYKKHIVFYIEAGTGWMSVWSLNPLLMNEFVVVGEKLGHDGLTRCARQGYCGAAG
jgi:hypothetical protein